MNITLKKIKPGIPFKMDGDTSMYIKLSPDQQYYSEPSKDFCRAMNTRSGSTFTFPDHTIVQIMSRTA